MRRFSTVAAAAILLFTAPSFAGYDEWSCNENSMMKLNGLQCISCGIQKYYRDNGKGEIMPSEKWLVTLAAGARSFRQLNPGEKGATSESIVRNDIAKKNMQSAVISQIQAYNFCTANGKRSIKPKTWSFINDFITNETSTSTDRQNDFAKFLGFDPSWRTSASARDLYKNLLEDSANTNLKEDPKTKLLYRETMANRRLLFNENVNELISRKDVDDELRDCLTEMKNRSKAEKPTDLQSYQFCKVMADSCDITDENFCATGLELPVKTGGSGSSSQGSGGSQQQPPRPVPASSKQPSGGKKLAPPPVQ